MTPHCEMPKLQLEIFSRHHLYFALTDMSVDIKILNVYETIEK